MANVKITKQTPGDTSWYTHDRFGLFIHWGLYSLPARHEWVKSYEEMDTETYNKYFNHFNPDLYNPKVWADAAEYAGMKYFVITTKHHEGFCLWDSQLTDYKATNTPARKDLLKPMVDAFREKNFKVGFYHSLLDWHHPHYTIDERHPMRNNQELVSKNNERDMNIYADYMHGQVKELLTGFGNIDMIWFDFSVVPSERFLGKGKEAWQSEKLIKMIRDINPSILINDRLEIDQDIKTPEQYQPRKWFEVDGQPVIWEACQTFSGAWGYFRDEESWKSVDMLIKMLIDSVSKGGNLILNVGPTGRGDIDSRALERLRGIGDWMKYHSRSIYGCTEAPEEFICPPDCRFTYNPEKNRLYLHIFSWPFKHIQIDKIADKVEYAQLLNDASEIQFVKGQRPTDVTAALGEVVEEVPNSTITFDLPVKKPNVTVPVIEIFLKN